jgi:CheY-like chemotaxis protein
VQFAVGGAVAEGPVEGDEAMAAGPCILVIEDDDAVRDLIQVALAGEGYEVVTAANGQIALRTLEATAPVLILADVRMPIMGGPEFIERYRQRPGPHAPIIAMSAATDPHAPPLAPIVADVLPKPFDLIALINLVERYTGGAG